MIKAMPSEYAKVNLPTLSTLVLKEGYPREEPRIFIVHQLEPDKGKLSTSDWPEGPRY